MVDAPLPISSRDVPIPSRGPEQPTTYYGRPALKPSLYGWTVALYIFIGGLAGTAQILATAADLVGMRDSAVVPAGRIIALAGAVLGGILLIVDLHTMRRFYNMLRIFRLTSAMSIGTYVLMTFGFWSLVALCAQFAGLRWLAALGGVIASVAGWGMMTYTAALLSSTSTPLWAAAPRLLAVRFAASWGRVIVYHSDVDTLYACVIAAGYRPDARPRDAESGERFYLTDPDGHELSFACAIATTSEYSTPKYRYLTCVRCGTC